MLSILKLVRGAVSDKNLIPVMSHFFIYQGRIQGTNGRVAIDAPIPQLEGYSLTVPADKFIKAIDGCSESVKIEITESKVIITDGKLKVRLPILANDAFPRSEPDKDEYTPEGPLLPALRRLLPFISTDASKAWSMGLLLSDSGSAYATNNMIMIKQDCDLLSGTGRSLNLPAYAIEEILSMGEEPTGFGIREDGGSITFYYESGAWLMCRVLTHEWPVETADKMFAAFPKKIKAIPEGMSKAVERIIPFCPNDMLPIICLTGSSIKTEEGDQSAEIEGFTFDQPMRFNGIMLKLVLTEAKKLQVSNGGPSFFSGDDGLRGLFVGIN